MPKQVRARHGRRSRGTRAARRPTRHYPRGINVPWPRAILRATIVCGLGFMWTWLVWFRPARSFPVIKGAIFAVDHVFNLVPIRGSLAWAFKSFVLVLVPVVVILAIVRRPTALGLGGVARYGWRIIVLGFAVALPFCIWLGLRPGMHTYYAHMFDDGGWKPLVANALVIVVEHAWIEGVILALALPGGGFASSSATSDPSRRGALAFLGFGFPADLPDDQRSLWQWLGVPAIVMPCLVLQALTFGAVHVGKEWGELVTAFPGGLGLGMLTYRIRSFWPSAVLHLGTGAIILLTILWTR
jgi:hypothetical protein